MYIEWDDLVSRYPVAGRNNQDANEVTSSFIVGAEAFINARLAKSYTVPFSPVPQLVKDLVIDLTYVKMSVGKIEDRETIKEHIVKTLDDLVNGDMLLVTDSGTTLAAIDNGVWSELGSYTSTFNVDDPLNWGVDSGRLSNIKNDRLY